MQKMLALIDANVVALTMPDPDRFVLPGIHWGAFDELFTPAYWRGQAWQAKLLGRRPDRRIGECLVEEVAACLLGGYGMPAEVGLAAFQRLKELGRLSAPTEASRIEKDLSAPLDIGGRAMRYRFPRQKARYLAACLAELADFDEPEDDVELRDRLVGLPGIGWKTGSWIVRNHRGSSAVAILDVHIIRAAAIMGLMPPTASPARDYLALERRFLDFASAIETPAAFLDGLIWRHMRILSTVARSVPLPATPNVSLPQTIAQ